MRRTRVFPVLALSVALLGCGGNPASPSAAGSPEATKASFDGMWTGAGRLQNCVDPAAAAQCVGVPALTRVQVTLSKGTSSQFQGTLQTNFGLFSVIGTDTAGVLNLTGHALVNGFTSNLTQATFRVSGSSMDGVFSFVAYTGRTTPPPPTLTFGLEQVYRGTTPQQLPAESRLDFQATPGFANRWGPTTGTAGATQYTVSYRISNASGIGGKIVDVAVTLFGPDGREYYITQAPFSPLPIPGIQGTGSALAGNDPDYKRPIATRYHVRISFLFDDGVSGTAEGSSTIDVLRDTYGH
jgi:hypothetical protein